jgi:hypothetical protein
VVRSEGVVMTMGAPPTENQTDAVITRAKRAHWRLSWEERLARNARPVTARPLTVTIHGLPDTFTHIYGFALLEAA